MNHAFPFSSRLSFLHFPAFELTFIPFPLFKINLPPIRTFIKLYLKNPRYSKYYKYIFISTFLVLGLTLDHIQLTLGLAELSPCKKENQSNI